MSYLNKFGLGNFKVFKNHNLYELSPITILTGKNNSGKSSLIKALLLLKDCFSDHPVSIESSENIYGHWSIIENMKFNKLVIDNNELKLGSHDQFLNFNNKNQKPLSFELPINNLIFPDGTIKLKYSFPDLETDTFYLSSFSIYNKRRCIVEYIISQIDNLFQLKDLSEFIRIDFQYFIDQIKDTFSEMLYEPSIKERIESGERIDKFIEHTRSLSKQIHQNQSVIDGIVGIFINDSEENFVEGGTSELKLKEDELVSIQKHIFKKSKIGKSKNLHYRNNILNKKNCLGLFQDYYIDLINDTEIPSVYQTEKVWIKSKFFDFVLFAIGRAFIELHGEMEFTSYLPSIRALNERLYRVSNEGYAIQRISQKEFEKIDFSRHDISNLLAETLKDFQIGENIEIKTYQRAATEITVIQNGRKILLSDLGFGFAQLFPIIFEILKMGSKCLMLEGREPLVSETTLPGPKILIEEPESNLHPDFQSKLADLFVKASNLFGIQFIIETHSEYLIRRLQYLTAKKEIKNSNVIIYYFNNPEKLDKSEKQINKINVLKNGSLSEDFGSGFYDEAITWKFELLKLKSAQKN